VLDLGAGGFRGVRTRFQREVENLRSEVDESGAKPSSQNSTSSPPTLDTLPVDTVYGVDFSGAQDAGDKIWISEGAFSNGTLEVQDCYPATELTGGDNGLTVSIEALVDLVLRQSGAAFGFDFPFGLPREITEFSDWERLVHELPLQYDEAEEFHHEYMERGRSLPGKFTKYKRVTDKVANAPDSPYDLMIYKQTYHGIGKLLRPLLDEENVRILPFDQWEGAETAVFEICPSSTLKDLGLPHDGYKGSDASNRSLREELLEKISGENAAVDPSVREKAIRRTGGDALDSIVASLAVARAVNTPPEGDPGPEGEIYV